MTECNHDCASCSENCSERSSEDFIAKPHALSKIKKVIGIVSGKGGVGKSLVTSLLTAAMQRKGFRTAVLDADVTGPSIPQMFGLRGNATADDTGIYPVQTKLGVKVISLNLLLEQATDPVVWRGPVIAGAVTQFWTDVVWGEVDYMFVDMPPGTGDVPLTVFQSLPVAGIVVVTSPQELVEMIVGKAVKMAQMMNVPILGIVENMSYFRCPDCNKVHKIYGESHVEEFAAQNGIDTVCKLPIDPALARMCDGGEIEAYVCENLNSLADKLARIK